MQPASPMSRQPSSNDWRVALAVVEPGGWTCRRARRDASVAARQRCYCPATVLHDFGVSPAAQEVLTSLAGVPVVDTHEHLRPPASLGPPMTPGRLLRRSYLTRNLRVSDGSPNGVEPNLESPSKAASLVRRVTVHRTRPASVPALPLADARPCRTLRSRGSRAERAHLERPVRGAAAAFQQHGSLLEGLDRANIEAVVWDPFWNTGQWQTEDAPSPPVVPDSTRASLPFTRTRPITMATMSFATGRLSSGWTLPAWLTSKPSSSAS